MPSRFNFSDKPARDGSAGRVSDARIDEGYRPFVHMNITVPPELFDRLVKYCNDDQRARSWAIQKALETFLIEKGY